VSVADWDRIYAAVVRRAVAWLPDAVFVQRKDGVNAANKLGLVPVNVGPPVLGPDFVTVTGPPGAFATAVPTSPVDADFVAHEAGHGAHDVASAQRDAVERKGTAAEDIVREVARIVSPGADWSADRLRFEYLAEAFRKAVTGNVAQDRYPVPPGQISPYPLAALRAYFATMNVPRIITPAPPTRPELMSVNGKGCDIASYQGQVDFDALKTEVAFVIAKSSEGTGYRDPTFLRNWDEARRVGLVRGAYHFARPDLGLQASDEASYFLGSVPAIDPGDLLGLDYEVSWGGDVVGWCLEWLELVRAATAIRPLIYLNLSLVRAHDWAPVVNRGYPLWLALYDGQPDVVPATPWPSVAIKQWTSSGTLAGVPGRVDLNTAFGGGEDLNEEQVLAIIEKNYGLTDTTKAIKETLEGQAAAITKLANDETLDDADVAALTARIDRLKTI
jgi:GH25 family lysozyme M1 (1,4-beta-N-acetylmuramidase)